VQVYPVVALVENFLRLVPIAILHRTLQIRAMVPVEVREDAILILQATVDPLGGIADGSKASAALGPGALGARRCSGSESGSGSGGGDGREGTADAVGDGVQGLRRGCMSGDHCGGWCAMWAPCN
jgi:hypothetical protein